MTDKQKLFCDEYLANGLNATQAYLKVYKNVKSSEVASRAGSRLLSFVEVKAYIQERMNEIHSKKTADIAEIMEYYTSSMRGEIKDEILTMDGEIKEVRISSKDRLKAADSLAKAHGLFEKNINLNVDLPIFSGEGDLED